MFFSDAGEMSVTTLMKFLPKVLPDSVLGMKDSDSYDKVKMEKWVQTVMHAYRKVGKISYFIFLLIK